MKRVLILTASTGGGHNAAAQALAAVGRQFPDIVTKVLKVDDAVGLAGKKIFISSYNILAGKLPRIWKFLYQATNSTVIQSLAEEVGAVLSSLSTQPIIQEAENFQPDYILATHPFAPYFFSKTKLADLPWGTVVTDYIWHEIWHHPIVNDYFVATKMVKNECKNRTHRDAHFFVTGIPVNPEFYIPKNQIYLRQKYQINPNQPCLLLLSGGEGLADVSDLIPEFSRLNQKVTIIVVTGRNVHLKQKLEKANWPAYCDYRIIGWTTAMDEYMRIADIIITKPGGLTVSECAALSRPMIMISPIPGQEEANAEYMESIGLGKIARTETATVDLVNDFLTHPWPKLNKKNLPAADAIWRVILS